MVKINPKLFADIICPVGKVEIFFDNNDHSNYLGFTWERTLVGRVAVGIDSNDTDFDTIGETGGSKYLETHHHTNQHYAVGTNAPGYSGWEGTIATTSGDTGVYLATANTTDAGSGNAGNLQPYQVVAYWKRVS